MKKHYYEMIAQNMAINHIILPGDPEENFDIFKVFLNDSIVDNHLNFNDSKRVIFVIGAGASKAIGLPLGRETIALIENEFNVGNKFLNYELDRLENVYRLQRSEFETQLLAYSKFQPIELRKILKNIFSHKFFPCMHYEILAHLFKHRFIDAIINFNFDEILDQAIEDEMEYSSYEKIISDGDISDDISKMQFTTCNNQTRFKYPLYIKPHGTVNHNSTMRFTREDYFTIPEDIHQITSELFKEPFILISVGFNMESFEFNKILASSAKRKDGNLFLIRTNKIAEHDLSKEIQPLFKDCIVIKTKHSEKTDQLRDFEIGLNEVMMKFYQDTVSCFKAYFKPKNIDRHILICTLFSRTAPSILTKEDQTKYKEQLRKYLLFRTKAEILLAIIKSKGFVVINQLKNGRAGKYYTYYKNTFEKPDLGLLSFIKICEEIGLYRSGYSLDTYSLKKLNTGSDENSKPNSGFDEVILKAEEFKDDFLEEILKTFKSLSLNSEVVLNARQYLLNRFHGTEVIITPLKDNSFDHLFHKYKPINSQKSLQYKTINLLKDQYWNILTIIAETGEWLIDKHILDIFEKKYKEDSSKFKIILIIADRTFENKIIKVLGKYGNIIEIKFIPWWLHNQHLTMTFYNRKPLKGIYFERRLRSQNISPILIEDSNECNKLVDTFFAYYLKSKFITEEKPYHEIKQENVKEITEQKLNDITQTFNT